MTAQEKNPLKPFSNGMRQRPVPAGLATHGQKHTTVAISSPKKTGVLRTPIAYLSTILTAVAPILPIIPVLFAAYPIF